MSSSGVVELNPPSLTIVGDINQIIRDMIIGDVETFSKERHLSDYAFGLSVRKLLVARRLYFNNIRFHKTKKRAICPSWSRMS